ncbi:uncharacterized protein LOC141594158 [Silene latifolia]|uniref:uncharacterized protein LOC141594158 n=1 Tax=Silene latifolia TaxID=37657 RepID=UPI003D786BF0
MARIFRRNLLSNNQSFTPTNHTNNPCPEFCDPSCDNFEECYTFPDTGSLPPLPPPLPPLTVIVSPVTTTTTQGAHVSPVVIIIVVVLASVFLLFSYYAVVIKYCTFWNRTIFGRAHDPPRSDSDQGDGRGTDGLIHENGDHDPMVVDHPIWLISTIGLHQSVINAITIVRYKSGDGLIDGSDCSVCLSEFQEGETLRLLPKCNHAFHIDCIDTWLRSHTNCPMCRAAIIANSGRQSLASNDPSFGHSRRVELNPTVDSDSSDVELGRRQIGNTSEVVEIGDVNNVDHDQNKQEVDFNAIVRRCFSMDYFRSSNFHNMDGNNSNSGSTRVMDSSSSSRPQPLRPPPIKRSYSWSERIFLSSCNLNNTNRDISP